VSGLPERFFEAARRVLLKESDRLEFDAADILRIARDTAMQAEFRETVRSEVNHMQLAHIVVHYLDEIASEHESRATISDRWAVLIDRAGMTVAGSVIVATAGVLGVSGASLGLVSLLSGGAISLFLTGAGRTMMKVSSLRRVSNSQRVRRLGRGLEVKE